MLFEKEVFDNWLQNPVTKYVMEIMRQERQECIECIASDSYILNPMYAQMAAKKAAAVVIYDNWLNVTYVNEDSEEVKVDG